MGDQIAQGQYEQERRRVSSVVLEESFMEPMPEDTVRYVEVPQIQEVIRYVPKKEVVEVEKRVPRYEVEYVDRVVDVPQVEYVDKHVEVPRYQELVKHVPIHQVIDVPKEIIKTVPKIETRVVEKVVEVQGEIIEVPKPYTVENKVTVPRYTDKHIPIVVAQTVRPVVTETHEEVEVEVMEYEPEIIQVEVQVPKPVPAQLIAEGVVEEVHRTVTVPHAHFNSLLRALNPHIHDAENILPFMRTDGGQVPFLPQGQRLQYMEPMSTAYIEGFNAQQGYGQPQSGYGQQPAGYGQQPRGFSGDMEAKMASVNRGSVQGSGMPMGYAQPRGMGEPSLSGSQKLMQTHTGSRRGSQMGSRVPSVPQPERFSFIGGSRASELRKPGKACC